MVLIVDDDPLILNALYRLFDKDAILATCIADGLEMALQHQPAVIILDVILGSESGIDAIPRFKSAAPGAAIIIISGRANAIDRHAARALGASAYMDKIALPSLMDVLPQILSDAKGSTVH